MFWFFAVIAVSTSFDGGSIGKVERVTPTHLRCAVKGQADQNGRNRQASWYYFKLGNLPRQEIRIDLTDLVGEYNFRPGTHPVSRNTRPVFSYDDRAWTHFTDEQVSWDEKEMRFTLRFTPSQPTIWIAHAAPYTKRELDRLLAIRHPHLQLGVAGRSAHGRDIPLLTITDPAVPDQGKKAIWLMARQHAWETGASWVADGAVRFLLSSDAQAARIRRSIIFWVIPMFDMDGVAEGAVRFNANGYDNNRNWDTAEPALMPEISSVRKAMMGRPMDVFLAMHNTESTDYVEGAAADPRIKPGAASLVAGLRETTDFYDPRSPRDSMSAPIAPGRYMVHQYLYKERKAPAFLMELMVDRHPQLGLPRTVRDFTDFGSGLVKSLAGAAQR